MDVKEYLSNIDLSNTKNKSDELLRVLTDLISSGTLPSGFLFPNENVMCATLHIGRGTLRGVYNILETQGVISRSKSGTTVNDIKSLSKNGLFNTSLMVADKDKLIEFLSIVEPAACQLAALNADENDISNIYQAMIECERANGNGDYQTVVDKNALFHERIRQACKNPILVSAIYSSRKKYDDGVVEELINDSKESKEFMDKCLYQHYSLYYAIKTKDALKASNIMKEHYLLDIDYINSLTKKEEKK